VYGVEKVAYKPGVMDNESRDKKDELAFVN